MPGDDRTVPPETSEDIAAAIDALYQGPPGAFVEARNHLARALRGRDREAAERVRALARPSLSAWAVNQAFWRARPELEAMLDAGEALRTLQQRAMRGEPAEGMAAASARLHEAVAAVARAAQHALEQDGHGAGPQLMRRVLTTLQALAAHGRADTAPPAGRLSADVDPPGFELLTALAPAAGPAPASRPNDAATDARRAPATGRAAAPAGTAPATGRTAPAGTAPAAGRTAEPAPDPAATRRSAQRAPHRSAPHRSAQRAPHRDATHSRKQAQARHAARARAAEAKAALVARQRALTTAEQDERAAAERLDAAEAAVAAARAALDRATLARDRARTAHEQARHDAGQARAALDAARTELESAENQAAALMRARGVDEPDPA